MKEIFEVFEKVLKENQEGTVAIINNAGNPDYTFSCRHIYEKNANNIFSFTVDRDAKCDFNNNPVVVQNGQNANYLCSGQCEYDGEQKKVSFILKSGTVKSVYGYTKKISFAIVPKRIIIWFNEERKIDCSYEDFLKYLKEKEGKY